MTGLLVTGLLAVGVLAGCGTGAASSPGPTSGASTAVAASQPAPSRTPRPRIYPYVLPYPEAELKAGWRYASTAWDGETRIDHGSGSTDWTKTRDGDLFAFGVRSTSTAKEIAAQTAAQANEWHGCDLEPLEQAALPGGGEEGILAVHDCNGERVIRWFAAHDGFGLRVMLILAPDADLDVARGHFEDAISKLTWLD